MRLFRPSKAKFISTLLILVAMWTADKLEDFIGHPLLARFAPSTSAAIESSGDNVERVEKTHESDVLLAGVILYGVEIVVKTTVSYVFACIIVHFFFDRRLNANNGLSSVSVTNSIDVAHAAANIFPKLHSKNSEEEQ